MGKTKQDLSTGSSQPWLHIWIPLQRKSSSSWKELNQIMERPQQRKSTWSAQFTKLSELPVKKAPEEHCKVLWKLKPREVATGSGLVPEPSGESQWGLRPAPQHSLLLHSLRFDSHLSWALVCIHFIYFFLSLPSFISQRFKNTGHRSWHWISAQ